MFTIRKATIDDRSLIHDLASRIWENTYGKILSKEQLDYMFDMMYAPDNILKQMEELHHQYFIILADAFNGNMLCLASSVFYAVYLVLSQRILQKVGTMTMLRYTFTGAAFSSLLILPIEGFHAPLFSEPFHCWPFAVLMFVLIFPTVISYLLIPIGLKYLKTTLVAIYGYLILIVATITSLLIGQDRFSWTQTFALICICAGVYLVEIAEGKEKKTVKV